MLHWRRGLRWWWGEGRGQGFGSAFKCRSRSSVLLKFGFGTRSSFSLECGPNPASLQSDKNLQLIAFRPSMAPWASIVSVHNSTYFEPGKLLNFELTRIRIQYHSNAGPDPASKNNADPDTDPQLWGGGGGRACYNCYPFGASFIKLEMRHS